MGTEMRGNKKTYLLIFLIVGVREVVEVDKIFRREMTPPIRGRIP